MTWPLEGSREIDEGIIISEPMDWCKSPTAIVPYRLYAYQREAMNLADRVKLTSDRTHVRDSIVLKSYGDEPGVGGGVISGTHNAECTPKTWSTSVTAESRNIVRHDDEWWMNHKNTWGRLNYVKDQGLYTTPAIQSVNPKMAPSPDQFEALYDPKTGSNTSTYDPMKKSNPIQMEESSPEERLGGFVGKVFHDIIHHYRDGARISQKFRQKLCEWACECLQNRGSSRTYQGCVAAKIRSEYYVPGSTHPAGGNLRPYSLDGPIPEANWQQTGPNSYGLVMSQSEPTMPSNAPVVSGAPRPDISYFNSGNLEYIYEMKFPGDTPTQMQANGAYENVLQSQGLDPNKSLIKINVEDCACYKNGNFGRKG